MEDSDIPHVRVAIGKAGSTLASTSLPRPLPRIDLVAVVAVVAFPRSSAVVLVVLFVVVL